MDFCLRSDVPGLEVPWIPSITACDEILQEREPHGSHAIGEVLHTYSSTFEPSTLKVRVLPVRLLLDETDRQSMHCVEEWGGWGKNSHYVSQFSA
jgi:hypothetical protein